MSKIGELLVTEVAGASSWCVYRAAEKKGEYKKEKEDSEMIFHIIVQSVSVDIKFSLSNKSTPRSSSFFKS